MANSVIKQELDVIESSLETTAAHLEGLANDGFGWTKPDAEAERQRFRAALRENAARLRQLAARVRVGEE
jgi:hypothetical protein